MRRQSASSFSALPQFSSPVEGARDESRAHAPPFRRASDEALLVAAAREAAGAPAARRSSSGGSRGAAAARGRW